MKTRCVILSKDDKILKLMQSYIEKLPFVKEVGSFKQYEKILDLHDEFTPDLIFVDQDTIAVEAISFAHSIPKFAKIIFITSKDQCLNPSTLYEVTDFVLKPLSFIEVSNICERINLEQDSLYTQVSPLANTRHKTIWIKSESKYVQIELSNISYIEGLKDYVFFHFANGARPLVTLLRMKRIATFLPEEFIRIHKSYIINMDHLNYVERDAAVVCGERLAMGMNFKANFKSKIKVSN